MEKRERIGEEETGKTKPYKMHLNSCRSGDWMNYKLESRLLGEISTTSDMQMIPL